MALSHSKKNTIRWEWLIPNKCLLLSEKAEWGLGMQLEFPAWLIALVEVMKTINMATNNKHKLHIKERMTAIHRSKSMPHQEERAVSQLVVALMMLHLKRVSMHTRKSNSSNLKMIMFSDNKISTAVASLMEVLKLQFPWINIPKVPRLFRATSRSYLQRIPDIKHSNVRLLHQWMTIKEEIIFLEANHKAEKIKFSVSVLNQEVIADQLQKNHQ